MYTYVTKDISWCTNLQLTTGNSSQVNGMIKKYIRTLQFLSYTCPSHSLSPFSSAYFKEHITVPLTPLVLLMDINTGRVPPMLLACLHRTYTTIVISIGY